MAQIASMEAVVAARLPSAPVASTSASTSRHAVVAGASLRGQNVYSLRGLPSAGVSSRSLSLRDKKAKLENTQQRRVPSISATIAAPEIVQRSVDIPKLAEELDSTSPLEIMDKALSMFGDDIAIAFRYQSHRLGRASRHQGVVSVFLNQIVLSLFPV